MCGRENTYKIKLATDFGFLDTFENCYGIVTQNYIETIFGGEGGQLTNIMAAFNS